MEDVAKQPRRSYEAWLADPQFKRRHAAVAATHADVPLPDGGLSVAAGVCMLLAIPHLLVGIPLLLANATQGDGGGSAVGAMVLGGGIALLVTGIVSYVEVSRRASHSKLPDR